MDEDGGFAAEQAQFAYDVGEDESLSSAVVTAVGSVRNRTPTELPPLYEQIDPNALDELFADTARGRPRADGEVVFDYCDCRVAVLAGGVVLVDEDRGS